MYLDKVVNLQISVYYSVYGKGGNSGYELKWIEETTQGSTVGLTTSEVYWLWEATLIKGDC